MSFPSYDILFELTSDAMVRVIVFAVQDGGKLVDEILEFAPVTE